MSKWKFLVPAIAAAAFTLGAASPATAQVSFGVQVGGPPPVCPYGYYDFAPYNCAPYGYYGPEWFNNGLFIGAGPWYHGRPGFYGHVDNHFDPHYGYHGPYPGRGEHFDNHRNFHDFHGHDMRGGYGGHDDHGHH
jgi:hypothetical protein